MVQCVPISLPSQHRGKPQLWPCLFFVPFGWFVHEVYKEREVTWLTRLQGLQLSLVLALQYEGCNNSSWSLWILTCTSCSKHINFRGRRRLFIFSLLSFKNGLALNNKVPNSALNYTAIEGWFWPFNDYRLPSYLCHTVIVLELINNAKRNKIII